MSAPATKRGVPDLDHAEMQTEKALSHLKQAMKAYGERHRYENCYLRLKRARRRTSEALDDLRKQKEQIHE